MKIAEQQVTYIDHCGSDLSVVNAARVSFHKESGFEYKSVDEYSEFEKLLAEGWTDDTDMDGWVYTARKLPDADVKLINYLAKHNHKSPFNHCFLSFRVKAPIFVARQLVKHEYLPWNEVSRRYVDEEPEFWFPKVWRKRADNVKQGSSDEGVVLKINTALDWTEDGLIETPYEFCEASLGLYQTLLLQKVAPEQARMVLPQNTMTEWVWSGTLFAFVKMLKLRLDPHAQQETREVAELIAKEIEPRFPVSYKALMEYGQT